MINVAIVEDRREEADRLNFCIEQYCKENAVEIVVTEYSSADSFLADYKSNFDIVFMDIELPGVDGMSAAKQLRERDNQVAIVFVTNMTKFAVKGYEVNALDYIVKPYDYQSFAFKLQRAINVAQSSSDVRIAVMQQSGVVRLPVKSIQYIEVTGHKLSYHTQEKTVQGTGSLSVVEKQLAQYGFLRCNNCYLVNPKFIDNISGHTIKMQNGDEVQISHPRKKAFMVELAKWLGQGNFV